MDCPALPVPANGGVTMTGITAGSVAAYFCDSGFMLSDNTPRTCQPDGAWDGVEPTCDRSELAMCMYNARPIHFIQNVGYSDVMYIVHT